MNYNKNFQIKHIKKKSCILYNNNFFQKIKRKPKNFNLFDIKTKKNSTERINVSINEKKSMSNTKTSPLSRPYVKQLSQYCFLTLKNKNKNQKKIKTKNKSKNNISKLNETNIIEKYNSSEKDDKTNIYFNLIKTYYDENGIQLKPEKTEIYPKINKSKSKKKKSSIDKTENNNCLNNEKINKTINNDHYCQIFTTLESKEEEEKNNKDTFYIINKKGIKNDKNINKRPLDISYGKINYNRRLKKIITSPSFLEKSFNIYYQPNSGDYIINNIITN